jgi:tetratricopeptide (TPR) repeat protein
VKASRRQLIDWMLVATAAAVFLLPAVMTAQEPQPESSSKPADAPESRSKQKSKKNSDGATQNAPDQPVWDPLRAEKDIEIGQFYMRKGDVDAAIDRFQDATTAKPGYAVPFRYLGEAQEKKGLKKEAMKSYQRYLDLYPHAEDGDKIRKKIDKLRAEVAKKKKD